MGLQGRPPPTPGVGDITVPAQGCTALHTHTCTQGSVCWCQLCRCPGCHPQSQPGLDGAQGSARHGGTLRGFGDLGSSIALPSASLVSCAHGSILMCTHAAGGGTGGAQAWPGRLWVPWDRALRKVSADKQAPSLLGYWDELGGQRAKQEGLSPRLHQQTQAGSPQYPADPSAWAHTDPRARPRPHGTHGPTEDTVKVSGAAVGAQGRGCRTSWGLKANAQIIRIFGKKPICII